MFAKVNTVFGTTSENPSPITLPGFLPRVPKRDWNERLVPAGKDEWPERTRLDGKPVKEKVNAKAKFVLVQPAGMLRPSGR